MLKLILTITQLSYCCSLDQKSRKRQDNINQNYGILRKELEIQISSREAKTNVDNYIVAKKTYVRQENTDYIRIHALNKDMV